MCAVICCFGESERKIKKNVCRGSVPKKRKKGLPSVRLSAVGGKENQSFRRFRNHVCELPSAHSFALLPCGEANTLLLCEVVCIWYIFFVCNRHFVLRRRTEVKTEIGNETGKIVSGVAPWPELTYSKQTPLPERPGFRAWAVICLWESIGTGGDTRFAQEDCCEADRGVKKRHLVVVVGRRSPKYPESSTENFLIG